MHKDIEKISPGPTRSEFLAKRDARDRLVEGQIHFWEQTPSGKPTVVTLFYDGPVGGFMLDGSQPVGDTSSMEVKREGLSIEVAGRTVSNPKVKRRKTVIKVHDEGAVHKLEIRRGGDKVTLKSTAHPARG